MTTSSYPVPSTVPAWSASHTSTPEPGGFSAQSARAGRAMEASIARASTMFEPTRTNDPKRSLTDKLSSQIS